MDWTRKVKTPKTGSWFEGGLWAWAWEGVLQISMPWLVINIWKQSQIQGKQQEAGSKQDGRWKQKSMEHASRNRFEMKRQTPTTVGHQPILAIEVWQISIVKCWTPTFLKHWTLILFDFATICPFAEKNI
jgi:hypothetical protein